MIKRSEAALVAKAKFFTAFNDIDVYVEDTANESRKVYVELLNRVFDKKILISQVFPIGSKPTVIRRCEADQGDRARPAVYIVDGDYDCLATGPSKLLRLYRLRRYCIENYLVDPRAVIDVVNDDSIHEDEAEIEKKIDFDGWLQKISPALSTLVLAMIAGMRRQCGLPTVRVKSSRYSRPASRPY
jgi:hypothetical protein